MIYDKFEDTEAIRPISRAVVSPSIEIKIGNVILGYIQNFAEAQARTANPQYEVGTEGIVELIPAQPTYTINVSKVGVYHYSLVKIFNDIGAQADSRYAAIQAQLAAKGHSTGDMFTNLVNMPIPFDILVKELNPGGADPANPSVMGTKYRDCFMTAYSRPILASGNLTVVETATISARDVKYSQIT